MADTYNCITCHKARKGRFTRRKEEGTGQWPKAGRSHDIPHWYCFTCLPLGQGKGEEDSTMPTATKALPGATSLVPAHINIEKEHQKGLAIVNPLIAEIESIDVVDEATYLQADAILGKVRNGRKVWGNIWNIIQERVVKPQREALDGVYSVNRDVDKPLEEGEKLLKRKMSDYKAQEQRLIALADRQREQEAERLQREIEEKARLEATARSPITRNRLATERVRLENTQQTVIETVMVPVAGASSSTRQVSYPQLKSLSMLAMALTAGSLKHETKVRGAIVEAVNSILRAEGKTNERKAELALWPGVELHTETQVVGR